MTVLTIELINPRARMLLDDLAKLDLIRIREEEEPQQSQQQFAALLNRLRSQAENAPTLEEITAEVESVRHTMQLGNG